MRPSRLTPNRFAPILVTAAMLAAAPGVSAQETQHAMHAPAKPAAHRIEVPPGAVGITLPELGVEIVAVRLTAAGGMLDLRYRVLDPVKAKPLMDPAVPISLSDPGTGAELRIPVDEQIGALRQSGSRIRPGQVLANLFSNPGHVVKTGGKINLRLGDLEVAGLTVEG